MHVKTMSSGRQPIAHSARAPISPYDSTSRRVMPIRIGRPVVPPVPWMRTMSSIAAHWFAPRISPSACDPAISCFSMNGRCARSATVRMSAGVAPACASFDASSGLVGAL